MNLSYASQSPPYYPPQYTPKKTPWALIIGLILIFVVVVGLVGYVALSSVQNAVNRASNLPNIVVTDASGTFNSQAGCSSGYSSMAFSAVLVNSGDSGFAHVIYTVNSQTVGANNYYVYGHSSQAISGTYGLSSCAHIGDQYTISIDREWPA